jgi:hypothetical protein
MRIERGGFLGLRVSRAGLVVGALLISRMRCTVSVIFFLWWTGVCSIDRLIDRRGSRLPCALRKDLLDELGLVRAACLSAAVGPPIHQLVNEAARRIWLR